MTAPGEDDREPPSMELEIELPGTPEQVWEAIATGPGISSWMHPTEVDEQAGTFSFDMGAGMEQAGEVTGWDPPHRFEQTTDWQPAGAEPGRLASEWRVEARSGDTCVLRLVVSGFGSGAGWDEELKGFRESMRQALDNLRLYLTYFPDQHGSGFSVFGTAHGSLDDAQADLTGALGISDVAEGASVAVRAGVPNLSGVVEQVREGAWRRDLVLRLEQPAPGLATVSVYGGQLDDAVPAGVPAGVADDARESLAGAVAASERLPASVSADLLDSAREAFTTGLNATAGAGGAVFVALAVLAVAALRHVPPSGAQAHAEAHPEAEEPEALAGVAS